MRNFAMRFLLQAAAAAVTLAAGPAAAASAVYRCPLGIDIAAAYAPDAKSVTLYVQGKTFRLPVAMSGSGARYSDGKTTIWEHQGTATFETAGVSFTACTAIPLSR